MRYENTHMLYDDGTYYNWEAPDNYDDPYYRKGADYTELNKTAGHELLYFINHLVQKHAGSIVASVDVCQKMEYLIRYELPASIRTYKKTEHWIIDKWDEDEEMSCRGKSVQ